MNIRDICIGLIGLLMFTQSVAAASGAEPLLEGLDQPWGMDFAPGHPDQGLITLKSGDLLAVRLSQQNGQRATVFLLGRISDAVVHGQGGLLDVAFHPQWPEKRWIYLTYSARSEGGYATTLGRAELTGEGPDTWQLGTVETLLQTHSEGGGNRHFGSRLAWDDQGRLYMSVGDRGERDRAQDLADHAGKVLRLTDSGAPAAGNPFADQAGALPEIFTLGHRNPQGMIWDAQTASIWLHEHGPRGGDELNQLQAGENYGWPVVTHGREYWGPRVSDHESLPEYVDPVHVWVPSIAPSGLARYPVAADLPFPEWQGAFLVGALKAQLLAVIPLEGSSTAAVAGAERRYLEAAGERIRDIHVQPAGEIYLLTDSGNGQLWQLRP